jgi:hypothetical protein
MRKNKNKKIPQFFIFKNDFLFLTKIYPILAKGWVWTPQTGQFSHPHGP